MSLESDPHQNEIDPNIALIKRSLNQSIYHAQNIYIRV